MPFPRDNLDTSTHLDHFHVLVGVAAAALAYLLNLVMYHEFGIDLPVTSSYQGSIQYLHHYHPVAVAVVVVVVVPVFEVSSWVVAGHDNRHNYLHLQATRRHNSNVQPVHNIMLQYLDSPLGK